MDRLRQPGAAQDCRPRQAARHHRRQQQGQRLCHQHRRRPVPGGQAHRQGDRGGQHRALALLCAERHVRQAHRQALLGSLIPKLQLRPLPGGHAHGKGDQDSQLPRQRGSVLPHRGGTPDRQCRPGQGRRTQGQLPQGRAHRRGGLQGSPTDLRRRPAAGTAQL